MKLDRLGDLFGQRREPDRRSPLVNALRIGQSGRFIPAIAGVQLGAENLRLSVCEPNAIGQTRRIDFRRLPFLGRLDQQGETNSLERQISICVLCEQPGRVCAFHANQGRCRPAGVLDDPLQPERVVLVNSNRLPDDGRPFGDEVGAGRLVGVAPAQ